VLMAVQALARELRTQLVQRGQYAGSKLELMDIYGVKLSELSAWPFYVGRFTRKALSAGFYNKGSQMRKKFKRNRKVAKKDSEENEPKRVPRPKRNSKKRDDDEYVE
jgi:phage tail tape-measure protein